ncbi:MAG: glycosyltransferase family 4 protein, partial [Paeniclostridium sp.]
MKVGFIHDHKFYEYNGKVYSKGGLPSKVLNRYSKIFGEVLVMGRVNKTNCTDGFVSSMGENITFKLNYKYKTPIQLLLKYNEIKLPIKEFLEEVDACIIRMPSILGLVAIRECIKVGKPWAVEVVGCCWDSLWNYDKVKGKILAPIMYALNRYYIGKSKFAIYVSEYFLQSRYPSKGIVASASDVCIDIMSDLVLEEREKKIENLSKNSEIILGIVGSLDVDYKGHRHAMVVISELVKKGYNVKLKCLGAGNPDRWINMSERLGISDRVEFCGFIPSGLPVINWLDNIDIFIIPSLTEGFPRILVEAMSRGCPCYGSSVGGIKELLRSNSTFKPKNKKQFIKIIESAILDKDSLKSNSKYNFIKSKQYTKSLLDEKR